MGVIGREQVLTTGGVTRLIDRMAAAGLVERTEDPTDRRGRLVHLTPRGEDIVVQASHLHLANIERYFLAPLPEANRQRFMDDLRTLSHAARDALPPMH